MANIKITDLTAYTNPEATDVLPIVDVGADVTKKVAVEDLLKNASSGTAAAPGIAFDGDSNTGIYSPGTDQVAVATNGTGRLFVDSSGNVGIGTTSPAYRLTVNDPAPEAITSKFSQGADTNFQLVAANGTGINSSGQEVSRFGINYGGTGWNSYLSFIRGSGAAVGSIAFAASGQEVLRIAADGNVGVGTNTPQVPLEVYRGPTEGDILRLSGSTDGSARPLTFSTETAGGFSGALHRATIESNAGTFAFSNLSGEKVRIDSSGNVGIGTSTPADKLEIGGNGSGIVLTSPNGTRYRITVADNGTLTTTAV